METKSCIVKKTDLEMLIQSRNKKAISEMIAQKQIALEDAINNAEFQSSIGLDEMADNETSRANRLIRDIDKLKSALYEGLNESEKRVLECMIENTVDNGGFILDELACFGEFTINQLKGYSSSLEKKGFIEMYNGECYNDGRAL